jgi:soluble lytic murein transglycosylase-like protein
MTLLAARIAALLLVLAAPAAGDPVPTVAAPPAASAERTAAAERTAGAAAAAPMFPVAVATPRPAVRPDAEEAPSCTGDGRVCIRPGSYLGDVCRAIEGAAAAAALDPGFFARLLWRESLFDANAVSPAGAQGIAQFMPGTAALRGLEDAFNPAEAIVASATYLAELEARFGNLGLAAAAYNAGEGGASRYLSGSSGLPGETRAYVLAITGWPARAWREAVEGGEVPAPDLSLDPERPFHEACLAKGRGWRGLSAPRPNLEPWAVVVAGQVTRAAAERRAAGLTSGSAAPLAGERIDYTRERLPGMRQARHFAQVGRGSRAEADALCAALRARGVSCIVRRN